MASGQADFCLTSIVRHYFTALRQEDVLPARFVAVISQHNPLGVLVPDDSPIIGLADLSQARLGGHPHNPHAMEVARAVCDLGLSAPVFVPVESSAAFMLAEGGIEAMVGFLDGLPRARRQAGIELRGIPLDTNTYASGLVAGDRVPADAVTRMTDAIVTALEQQRKDPEASLAAYCERYPATHPDDALEGWRLVEPYIFLPGVPTGSMDRGRWERTLAYAAGVHGVPVPSGESVYRPELPIGTPGHLHDQRSGD